MFEIWLLTVFSNSPWPIELTVTLIFPRYSLLNSVIISLNEAKSSPATTVVKSNSTSSNSTLLFASKDNEPVVSHHGFFISSLSLADDESVVCDVFVLLELSSTDVAGVELLFPPQALNVKANKAKIYLLNFLIHFLL